MRECGEPDCRVLKNPGTLVSWLKCHGPADGRCRGHTCHSEFFDSPASTQKRNSKAEACAWRSLPRSGKGARGELRHPSVPPCPSGDEVSRAYIGHSGAPI